MDRPSIHSKLEDAARQNLKRNRARESLDADPTKNDRNFSAVTPSAWQGKDYTSKDYDGKDYSGHDYSGKDYNGKDYNDKDYNGGSDPKGSSLLNFTTAADEMEANLKRQKLPRDPMSHRIIEKRRRDRMNNCLADLSRLIPSSFHKQGQGRIEKTEIIEMAIKHIDMLQNKVDDSEKKSKEDCPAPPSSTKEQQCCQTKFYLGFKEAQDEVMRYLVDVQSVSVMDPFCQRIMTHLEKASNKFGGKSAPHRHTKGRESSPKSPSPSMSETSPSRAPRPYQKSAFYDPANSGPFRDLEESQTSQDLEAKRIRDKQMRSLLADEQNNTERSRSEAERAERSERTESLAGADTGMPSPHGMVPMFSYSSQLSGHGGGGSGTDMGSSGYSSDMSGADKTSPYPLSSRDNLYKFKHNITKRFSQEGRHKHRMHPSDASSSSSSHEQEDEQRKHKWKGHNHSSHSHKALLPGSDMFNNKMRDEGHASFTPISEYSGEPRKRLRLSSKASLDGDSSQSQSSFILPGFILHPSGTHYMPISVQNTNISGMLDSPLDTDTGGPPVFHPISIPVHFRRPVI